MKTQIIGVSMKPTFNNKEKITYDIIDKLYPGCFALASIDGEIVIKRVVAVEGDEVEWIHGRLFVNDKNIEINKESQFNQNIEKIIIPEDSVYLCGDNLDESIDSRLYGPIKTSLVAGINVTSVKKGMFK